MPKEYTSMRDKFKAEYRKKGYSEDKADKAAKSKAARIYNSRHPKKPVTRKGD